MSNLNSTIKNNSIPFELGENWKWFKWGDLIESYQQGLIRSNSELNLEKGIDYFKMNFIDEKGQYSFKGLPKTFAKKEEIEKYRIYSGDFFLNVRNSKELVGKSCVVYNVDRDILFNHMLVRIAHKEYVTGSFINAYFNTGFGKKLLDTCKKGTTTVVALYQKDLFDLPVPIPDEKLLERIDSIYNSLNNKIELNNRINAELEAMAKLIYEYWFVQFDFPDKDGKPYKSSGGKMVWNKELKRETPKGWEIVGLEDLAEFNPSLKIERNSEAPYLGMTSISTTGYMTDVPEKKEFSGGIKFQNGDIIVARITPCLENGKTALITMLEKVSIGFGSTEFINIRAKEKSHVSFLAILSRSDLFRHYAISKMTGTSGRKRVDSKDLAKFQLAKPLSELLKKYGEIVNSYFEKMTINSKQNQELASLRDWLLPMLMNGQVTVADAEEIVEEKLGMVAEPHETYGKEVALNIPDNRKGFAKQVLAGKIVSEFRNDPNFSSIKFQKVQFLAEHIIEVDLNLNYYYQSAGPYDNRFMHTIYTDFRKQKWFDCQNSRFIPLEKQGKIEVYFQGYFAPAQKRLARLFELLSPMSEAEAEIIATVYAVWNNRLIERRTVGEDELMEDFYLWSDRKHQYTKEQISSGIKWLYDNQIVPRGFGKLIKKAKRR